MGAPTRPHGRDKGPSDRSPRCPAGQSPRRRKESQEAAAQQGLGLGERAPGCRSSTALLCEVTRVPPDPVTAPALASVSSYRSR